MTMNKHNCLLALVVTLLFILISSPCMYKITGKTTSLVNWETSNNGCPNLMGLLLHTIVFLLLASVIIMLMNTKEGFGFRGLVDPANMLMINNLRIEAQDKGCDVDEVIRQVQLHPYNKKKAKKAVAYCRENCPGLSEKQLHILANIPSWEPAPTYTTC